MPDEVLDFKVYGFQNYTRLFGIEGYNLQLEVIEDVWDQDCINGFKALTYNNEGLYCSGIDCKVLARDPDNLVSILKSNTMNFY